MRRRERVRVAWAAVLLGAFGVPAGAARGDNYAFLVGISDYTRTKEVELKPLRYARNDIVEFYHELQKTGFKKQNIVLMHEAQTDPSLLPETRKIKAQLDLLVQSVDPDDTLVIALAGHGVQFFGDATSYFCPVDAVLADRATLVPLEEIYRQLNDCSAGRKLMLVDACRNDPQSVVARARPSVKLESVTRPQEDAIPKGIAAIFSCKPGQQSFEDEKLQHGVFFYHVLQGWKGAADGDEDAGRPADGVVTLQELSEYVMDQTKTYTRLHLKKSQSPVTRNETDDTHAWVLSRLGPARVGVLTHFRTANELRLAGRAEPARSEFTRAIQADPSFVKAYVGRGLAHVALNDLPSAIADFTEAIRREPENASALVCRAAVHGRGGDFLRAEQDYTRALAIDAGSANAYAGRGAARASMRRLDEALTDLDRAIECNPLAADAYHNRAIVRRRKGDAQGADDDLRKAADLERRRTTATGPDGAGPRPSRPRP